MNNFIQKIKNKFLRLIHNAELSKVHLSVLQNKKQITSILIRHLILQRKVDTLEKRIEQLELLIKENNARSTRTIEKDN